MAKFAPVAPAHIVHDLDPRCRGDYHLILAHDVVKHPKEYAEVYDQWGMTVIMDNSVVELGGAVDLEMVADAVGHSNANIIVLPDVYKHGPATTDSILSAHPRWASTFKAHLETRKNAGFMVVPQGPGLEDFVKCAETLTDLPHVTMWGIPRNLVEVVGSREQATQICHMLAPERPIHLLGFSDNLIDDMLCAHLPRVTGIDSAVPLRAASLGMRMTLTITMPPRGTWWDEAKFHPDMNANIDIVHRWLRRNGR